LLILKKCKKKVYIYYKVMTLKKLTDTQKKQLEKHKVHHSKKHMASMRMNMMRGDTFKEAHDKAQKLIGK